MKPERARVQAESCDENGVFIRPTSKHIPPGSITWEEHELAWEEYARRYGYSQDALRIHERGGFGYWELKKFLGHEPKTWKPEKSDEYGASCLFI